MPGFPVTPIIRAHLDLLEVHDNLARARGWIFRPDVAAESVDINLNGCPWVTSLRLSERDEVRLHFERALGWFWSQPLRCGFDVTYQLPPGCDLSQPVVLSVALYDCASEALGIWYTYNGRVSSSYDVVKNEPPAHLQERVGGAARFSVGGNTACELDYELRQQIQSCHRYSQNSRLGLWLRTGY